MNSSKKLVIDFAVWCTKTEYRQLTGDGFSRINWKIGKGFIKAKKIPELGIELVKRPANS